MSSRSSASTVNLSKAQSPRIFELLELPSELRDIIYGMLLTTPYCTRLDRKGRVLQFHLHTAILLVNTGYLPALKTPKFERLSVKTITRPVLHIEIARLADDGDVRVDDAQAIPVRPETIITTAEGLQSIISAFWLFAVEDDGSILDGVISHSDLRLSLELKPKAASQYQTLSEIVLKPWDMIIGVKELVLKGDIGETMRSHLEKSNLEGPFLNHVTAHLKEFHNLAVQEYYQESFNAAQWCWQMLDDYWNYLHNLRESQDGSRRICLQNDGLLHVSMKSYSLYYKGLLKLVRACLRQLQYEKAVRYAEHALSNMYDDARAYLDFAQEFIAILQAKFYLSISLAYTALGTTGYGMQDLKFAAQLFYDCNLDNDDLSETGLTEELKVALRNELIRLNSPWRCDFEVRVSSRDKNGSDWQVGECQRSFWEWLDLPNGEK